MDRFDAAFWISLGILLVGLSAADLISAGRLRPVLALVLLVAAIALWWRWRGRRIS